jgi:hypothetical protein
MQVSLDFMGLGKCAMWVSWWWNSHETLIISLFINRAQRHQICLCSIKFNAHEIYGDTPKSLHYVIPPSLRPTSRPHKEGVRTVAAVGTVHTQFVCPAMGTVSASWALDPWWIGWVPNVFWWFTRTHLPFNTCLFQQKKRHSILRWKKRSSKISDADSSVILIISLPFFSFFFE